jgi:Kef-type K+ transport system membrane component KefB
VEADLVSLLVIAAVAALAPILADMSGAARLPVVVIEIAFGILIGPQLLGFAEPDDLIGFFSQLGLAFLFFMAGLEIDMRIIRGRPGRLAGIGWVASLALGLAFALVLQVEGVVLSTLLVGIALATTALGTLVPVLRDAGVLGTPFGDATLAVGAAGELGPILVMSLVLTSDSGVVATILLLTFTAVALGAAWAATHVRPSRIVRVVERTMHASGQLAVRLTVVLIIGLVVLAVELGQDLVLGGFAAGLVVGLVTRGPAAEPLRVKLEGMAFGFFVPIFFVYSGMTFDLDALLSSASAMLKLPLFLLLFLVVRGLPALLFRGQVRRDELPALALLSATALPLVVAITQIGLETGRMAADTAAALVGAGMLSVLAFPAISLLILRHAGPGPPTPFILPQSRSAHADP